MGKAPERPRIGMKRKVGGDADSAQASASRRPTKRARSRSAQRSGAVELSWAQAQRLLAHPQRKVIGKGGYGWIAKVPFRGRLCAMKTGFKKKDDTGETGIEMLLREIDYTLDSFSPNVVRVLAYHYGDDERGTPPMLLLEWASGGDLMTTDVDDREEVLDRVEELLEAVIAIHRRGICHFDLKPENLLLAKDGSVRVGDFGLAMPISEARAITGSETCGSPGFEAPECHLKAWEERRLGKHCTKIDVFAVGMTAALLLAWVPDVEDQDVLQAAADKVEEPPHFLDLRTDLRVRDKGLRAFFVRTLARDPAARATPKEALALLRAARRK